MDITPFAPSLREGASQKSSCGSVHVSELLTCSLMTDFSDSFKVSPQSSTRTYSALPELRHPHSFLLLPLPPLVAPPSPTASQLTPHSEPHSATLASMKLCKHRSSPQGLCTHCALPGSSPKYPLGSIPQFIQVFGQTPPPTIQVTSTPTHPSPCPLPCLSSEDS